MRHVFLAFTNPVPSQESAFNAWYDDFHLREVVEYGAGMQGGQRFRLAAAQRPGQAAPPWSYLAWYDLEHDDLADYHRHPWTVERPPLKPFTGLVADDHVGWIYSPLGDWIGAPREPRRGAAAGRFLFMAFTNAGEGQETAFNAWYDQQHLPEVVAQLPGFVAGRRYRVADAQRENQVQPPWRYLAIYEVEAKDAGAVHAQASGVAGLTRAPAGALDSNHVAWVFEPAGGYHAGKAS